MTALDRKQPYPGLRPYGRRDADYFFGRETQTRRLREKLADNRLVAVVGRSGCGKSSLVLAGLIPLLRKEAGSGTEQAWQIATFRPRGQPIAELAKELLKLEARMHAGAKNDGETTIELPAGAEKRQALTDSDKRELGRLDAMLRRSSQGLVKVVTELDLPQETGLLLIIDQFEEIFRFEGRDADADEPTAFVRLLMEAIASKDVNICVMLTMRLDFLGDCARFQRLPEAISAGQFLVPNLSRAERRAAIEEPAKKCDVTVSPAVTQRLLNEIGEDPDRLPVLQHVLMRTWQEAKGAPEIKLEHYDATGGVTNAISRHADTVYDALPGTEHRTIAERMFKAVSELDRRGRAIRRPVRLGELVEVTTGVPQGDGAPQEAAARERVECVVNAYRAPECCMLMPPADEPLETETLIDISHESLLRGWVKMTGTRVGEGWLMEEDRDGKTYSGLVDHAEKYQKDTTAVLSRRQTRDYTAWWKRRQPNATWARRYGNRFGPVETLLERSVARQHRTRFWAIAAAMIVAAVMCGLGYLYLNAEHNRMMAEAEQERTKLEAAQARANQDERLLQVTQLAETEAATRKLQVDGLQTEIKKLQEQLKARGVDAPSDDTAQQIVLLSASAQQANPASAMANQSGYMWIGSAERPNLRDARNNLVQPNDIRKGAQYFVENNTFLRQGLPSDEVTYRQTPTIGILPVGSTVRAQDTPEAFERPSGTQYWLSVRVVNALRLPTVFFQYTGGDSASGSASVLSQRLQQRGYKVPGEERVDAAQGRREVRYFYKEDKEAADALAQDVRKIVLDEATLADFPVTVRPFLDGSGRKNAPGTVELWYDFGGGGGSKKGGKAP